MSDLTPAEIKAAEEACEKATEGPWAWTQTGEKCNEYRIGVAFDRNDKQLSGMVQMDHEEISPDGDPIFVEDVLIREYIGGAEGATVNYDDADFICLARSVLPRALAQLKSQAKRIEELEVENRNMRETLLLEASLSLSHGLPTWKEGSFKQGFEAATEEALFRLNEMRTGSYVLNDNGELALGPLKPADKESSA